MSDGDLWLARARAIVDATRPLLDNYGLAPAAELTIALDGHPCPGYRHDTCQILFCPPVIESNRDRLRWLFFCRVMGCADLAEARAFYEVALPLIVCHELGHHLRLSLGVDADSAFVEEQVCDRIAVALVERMPAYAPTLAPLAARCATMRERLGGQYGERAGSQFLPGLGEVLVARAELDGERLAALEALAAGRATPLAELLEVAVGAEAVTAARTSRDLAQVMVDSRYTEDPSEYWYLSLTWVAAYLSRPRAADLQEVVRDHLRSRSMAPEPPTLPSRDAADESLDAEACAVLLARCGQTAALARTLGGSPIAVLARRQLELEARRMAVELCRAVVPPNLAEAVFALAEHVDLGALHGVPDRWRAPIEAALRGDGYPPISSDSPVVRAALYPEDSMLTTIEKTLALESVALFAHLPPDRLWQLAERAVDEVIDPDEAVFREGEPGQRLFLVLDGTVRVEKQHDDGSAVELAVLGRGASFGEMALFDGQPRSATARAVGACRVLSVERHHVERLGRAHPEIYEALLRALSERLRATSRQVAG